MFARNRINAVLSFVLLSAIAAASGCASASKGEKMLQSFERTRSTLAEAQDQVDVTLGALYRLRMTDSENLKGAFNHYKEAVAGLEKAATNGKWLTQSMKENADTNIAAWQEEMKTIKDPTITASLESRREAVRTNYKLLQMYADDARKAYEPFLRSNKEMVQALSIDLSPAAVSSLAESMDRLGGDGQKLKQRIAAMQLAMNNMANGVSAIGP
jgi:hypothetical protein